jgi:uncharacterized protein (UPF0212 family)
LNDGFVFENNGKFFIWNSWKPWIPWYIGGNVMAKCPKCGTNVAAPKKKWTMAGRPDKAGKRIQLEIGLFDCPKCKKPFREVLSKKKI